MVTAVPGVIPKNAKFPAASVVVDPTDPLLTVTPATPRPLRVIFPVALTPLASAAWTATATSNVLPEVVLPCNGERGLPVFIKIVTRSDTVRVESVPNKSAAAPATWGEAIDVPLSG
jgi:hypothetical protein